MQHNRLFVHEPKKHLNFCPTFVKCVSNIWGNEQIYHANFWLHIWQTYISISNHLLNLSSQSELPIHIVQLRHTLQTTYSCIPYNQSRRILKSSLCSLPFLWDVELLIWWCISTNKISFYLDHTTHQSIASFKTYFEYSSHPVQNNTSRNWHFTWSQDQRYIKDIFRQRIHVYFPPKPRGHKANLYWSQ